ncbi:integral membrane plasmid transfer protein [Streptomyces sp. AC563]|uniref:Pycsar system effector family protein n=1 Tax=Streptomyces buecherae TaxID=2763006 RepID=UPI00164CFB18|nr:Pycsar system effector family protein [Streptomyces buecherae]MBC3988038.1 integral membrane plasmid transfer protein [Streptomyces buecherae]
MSTSPDPTTDRTAAAHAEVRADLARADAKAGLPLAFDAGLAAGVWTVARNGQPAATVAAGLAGTAVLVSVLLLLAVVLPRRPAAGRRPTGGWPLWATLTPAEFRAEMVADRRDEDTIALSRLTDRKMRHLLYAVYASAAATVLLAAAGLLAVTL